MHVYSRCVRVSFCRWDGGDSDNTKVVEENMKVFGMSNKGLVFFLISFCPKLQSASFA